MRICLYKRGTSNFENNGLGILYGAFDCTVRDTVNDLFTCDFKYPITGKLFTSIGVGDIIRVDASPTLRGQRFVIQTIEQGDGGYITIHCLHKCIVDMASDYLKEPLVSTTPQSLETVLNLAFNKSFKCKNYIGKSDVLNGQDYNISRRNIQSALLGKEGSIADTFGNGVEVEYDNQKGDIVRVNKRRGQDTNRAISYAKNINGYKCIEDTQELYTVIIPFAKAKDQANSNTLIYGNPIYAPNWDDFGGELYIKEQDMSDRFEQDEEITIEKLDNHAVNYITESKCNEPRFTFKIDFIQLENKYIDEYSLDELYNINIGDTIFIFHKLYNVRTKARIASLAYDPLGQRITSLVIGDVRPIFTANDGQDGQNGQDGQDGQDGTDGVPGEPGKDGVSTYTWIKYARSNAGADMSDVPDDRDYMGLAYNKQTPIESNNPQDYTWSKFRGDDGLPGLNGEDGTTYYTWIKYADDANGLNMSDNPEGKKYLGIAYNKLSIDESNDPKVYTWSLFKGSDGKDGIDGVPGQNGADGKTYYTWVKYADDVQGNGMSDYPNNKKYIGLAYNKDNTVESDNPQDYKWALFRGADGVDGTDGVIYYTWIRYADDAQGNGMSQYPANKYYIGIAYNKASATESDDPSEYKWSIFRGTDGKDGADGIPGVDGIDGKTYYTWLRYADDIHGNGMSDNPEGKFYIGLAHNKESAVESSNPKDYTWSRFRGENGIDGIPGKPGADGKTYYTWIRYADDSSGNGISNIPDGKSYIGFAYKKTSPIESDEPTDYKWSLIKGTDGVDGIDGINGKTYYTWIKYSDNADGNPCYDLPNDNTKYIGIAINKEVREESTNHLEYTWSKFKGTDGADGVPGTDGVTYYTWIKYADDIHGNGMSDLPDDKYFIGLAHNKESAVESNIPSDYTWSLFRGADGLDGTDGVPGEPGEDGKTYYTWIKYADDEQGTNMSDNPDGKSYLGLAHNKERNIESENPKDYTWSKFRGEDGIDGIPGQNGADGKTYYTWIKYADDIHGNGMSDAPEGKSYLGLAYNKESKVESSNPQDYIWSKFKGDDGSMEALPDELPETPTLQYQVYGAHTIELAWTFDNKFYYDYELYAGDSEGFTPTVFDRVFKGKASTHLYNAMPPKVMYFKVRAVNTHGKATPYSNEVEVVIQRLEDMNNYFSDVAIGKAVVKSLTADYMTAGIIKANWVEFRNLKIVDGNGITTMEVTDNNQINLNVAKMAINSQSVATEGYVTNIETDLSAQMGGISKRVETIEGDYVTGTEFNQTTDGFNLKWNQNDFSNLILNGNIASGVEYFTPYVTTKLSVEDDGLVVGARQVYQSEYLGFQTSTFIVAKDIQYSISFLAHSYYDIPWLNYICLVKSDGTWVRLPVELDINNSSYVYRTYTFNASFTDTVSLFIGMRGYLTLSSGFRIKDICIVQGDTPRRWRPSANEISLGALTANLNGIKLRYSDGSYTAMEYGGFAWYREDLKKEYHCLADTGWVNLSTGVWNAGADAYDLKITLPAYFKGKHFTVSSNIQGWFLSSDYPLNHLVVDIPYNTIDFSNATFTIRVKSLTRDGSWQTNVNIGWIAIA